MKISNLEKVGLASLFFAGCTPSITDQDVGDTCKAVQEVVFALNTNPVYSEPTILKKAEEKSKEVHDECEALDQGEQEKLLMSYVMVLSVTRTSY